MGGISRLKYIIEKTWEKHLYQMEPTSSSKVMVEIGKVLTAILAQTQRTPVQYVLSQVVWKVPLQEM